MKLKDLTMEEFDSLIYDDEEQALILFHKNGCNACHDVLRELEQLENFDGWTFAGVDALKEKELFSRFRLDGVPQVLLFQGGNLIRTLSGKKTQDEYENAMKFFDYRDEKNLSEKFSGSNRCCDDICYFADVI